MTGCPITVTSIRRVGIEQYELVLEPCDVSEILSNNDYTQDQKVLLITQKVSSIFCNHIREFPEGWFWMHKRWRTAQTKEAETFYL